MTDRNSTVDESFDSADATYVAPVESFEDGDRRIVETSGREVGVFRIDGAFYAVANHCVHQGGPVCEGILSGTVDVDDDGALSYEHDERILSCPWHGWEFDVTNGEHLSNPSYRLTTYEIVVHDDDVYLCR